MIGPRNATLGEEIYREIENNEYLKELFSDIIYKYSSMLFNLPNINESEINITDALRFADLLSKSADLPNSEKHKTIAQEIIALLYYLYPNNDKVQLYANSVLSNIGNYRGLQLVPSNITNDSFLENIYTNFDKQYLAIPFQEEKYFFPSQKAIYDRMNDENFSYSGPTSMGKSLVMRTFIKEKILNGTNSNFAILVPTKALINEITTSIINDLKELLKEKDYVVVNSSGALALNEQHKFIFVLTPERLLYMLISLPEIKIDYLFIDEAHKISTKDPRSTFYYKVTDMLSKREGKPHIIFASPNIPNPDVYLNLIPDIANKEDKALKTTYSPVSHLKYFVDLIDKNVSIFNDLSNNFEQLYIINSEIFVVDFIKDLLSHAEDVQNIVYCNSKDSAINTAIQFASNLQDKNIIELKSLANEIKKEIHSVYYLAELIEKGVAFHVGYLPSYIRNSIEKLYREKKITTLFCTSTLMEGVNLPADNLFILSYQNGLSNMKPVEFKNLIGRVGRIEYNLYGNVFFIRHKDSQERERYMELVGAEIPEQKLSLLSGLSKTQKEKIVDSLVAGNIKLLKYPDKQTAENYSLMRKFALILLKDIMNESISLVYSTFEPLLNPEKLNMIKHHFNRDNEVKPDDDINVSTDQTKNLITAIKRDLTYPPVNDGIIRYEDILQFLETLSIIFNWDYYESKTLGKRNFEGDHSVLKWYAVILNQWISGYGFNNIISSAIRHKQSIPNSTLEHYGQFIPYNDSTEHKNIIIADVLDTIDNIILFSISNYFLRFSTEYKIVHNIEDNFDNDWYEYVEYGTTNKLTIFLQRNGFSRETSSYIKDKKDKYVTVTETGIKLKKILTDCPKESVKVEVNDILYNLPDLFE